MDIVIRGGKIDAANLAKNPEEYSTQDELDGLSVYIGSVKNLDSRNAAQIWAVAEGYPGNTISAVDRKWFDQAGATIKKNKLPNQPNHALLSGITIEEAVELFTRYRGATLTR